MDNQDETLKEKETARKEEDPGKEIRTIPKEDPAKEYEEYLQNIGVCI